MSLATGFLDTGGKIFLSISTFIVVVGLGSCAVFIGWFKRKQNPESDNLEFFLTARSTQPALRVAWSFVAGGLGAWILTSPSSIAEDAGILGVVSYSVFAGLPIFLIAMVGARIQKALPKVLSFSDYIYHRFGVVPQLYVTLIVLLNLGVTMTAEYTAISAIFEACLGQNNFPIAIGLSIVTSAYTACGGLLVSILTDQYQAIFGSILISIITLTLATSFHPTLGPLPENLAPSSKGYHMLFIMPVTLSCSTVFSEAPWQRIWASESPRALRIGSFMASCILSLIVFIFGMIGFWANWAGYSYSTTNLVVFALISDNFSQWLVVLLAVLAVVMCESAVDTLQNALVSTISTMVLRNKPMLWTRVTVLLLNIPPIMLSYYKFDTFLLFQVGNKITCTAALPMLVGLYHPTQAIITGTCVLFASLFSLVCVMLYGFFSCREVSSVAFQFAFTDPYDPYSVLVAVVFSLLGIFIWVSFTYLLKYFGHNGNELSWFQPGYKKAPHDCQIIDEVEGTHSTSN